MPSRDVPSLERALPLQVNILLPQRKQSLHATFSLATNDCTLIPYNLSSLDLYTRIREMNKHPTRVIIKAHLRDIPAETTQRVYRLRSDFCEQMLGRRINIQVQQGGYDAMHFLPGFDSAAQDDENISKYLMYDFNVTRRLDKEEIPGIEHKFYLATRVRDAYLRSKKKINSGHGLVLIHNRIFTPRERWVNSSRSYAPHYVWGGVGEQKILSSIKSL
ncbi:hypothetical protein DL95DRAFT_14687 [Leptodontidium sp. 2 PMI_412]|nr:hypothetical protein DL95DRAFT_14687 [Leptodontidium sp. 2 PMI_412]